MTVDELWRHFFYHLNIRKRSKATIRYYEVTRRAFQRFSDERQLSCRADEVTVWQLREFILSLEARGLAAGGIHAHGRAIRAVFSWAYKEELLKNNPAKRLELPSMPKERQPVVTSGLLKQLINQTKDSDQPLRDRAILLVFFDTGIRVSELIGLGMDDFLVEKGLLRVMGKGAKQRFVPIGEKASRAILSYIRRERSSKITAVNRLFLNRWGQSLTTSGISIRLAKLSKQLSLARETSAPHAFRRGFAVEFLRNGGDIFTLQQIMGHTNLEMTRRYVYFLDDDLKSAHVRFSPVDNL